MASLLYVLADAGAAAQVGALADRAADHTPLSYCGGLIDLLEQLARLGAKKQIMRLAQRIADRAPLEEYGDMEDLEKLVKAMRWMGATKQADTLINRMPAAGLFVGSSCIRVFGNTSASAGSLMASLPDRGDGTTWTDRDR